MEYKNCLKCKVKLPAILKYFYADKRAKNGLQSWCKKCQKSYWQTKRGKHIHRTIVKKYYCTIKGHLRQIFNNINQRCNNPKVHNYNRYGGRGIKNKFKSLNEFRDYIIKELQIDPRGLQIDRIDNNRHYEKGNIRFVTCKENNNNRNGKFKLKPK